MTKIIKAVKTGAAPLTAFSLTAILFFAYFINVNLITAKNINNYKLGNSSVCTSLEIIENGRFTSYFSGYCFDKDNALKYYNFGLNESGEGVIFNSALALVKDDKVYKLPTNAFLRKDMKDLPDAPSIKNMASYNIYAGTETKFFHFLLPKGDYEIAFIHTNNENQSFLILSGERWNNA